MAHACCSEYCRYPLKPPEFPLELVQFLSPHLAELYNQTVFGISEILEPEEPNNNQIVSQDKFPAFALPLSSLFSSKYVASFYPVIGALLLLVIVLLIMRVSIFFRGRIPKPITRPLSRSCLKRSDSVHEYDAIGMSTTEVTEISPVFLCLQPYNEQQSSAAGTVKSEKASSTNENEAQTTPHSSPHASSEAGESLANERCSSVLSSSTNGDAPSAKRNKAIRVANTVGTASNEHSLRSSATNKSLQSSLRHSHNKFHNAINSNGKCFHNGTVNGIVLMGSPITNHGAANILSNDSKVILANGNPGVDRMSTAVSRMNENGSVTSVLTNGGPHPTVYSNGVNHRYISC